MLRLFSLAVVTAVVALSLVSSALAAEQISGHYLEARTCQVYTGPCFANSEVGITGQDAIMAWSIKSGKHQGVDLAGLNVVMVVRASETLGFGGIDGAGPVKSVVYVDNRANEQAQAALVQFAKDHAGKAGQGVVRVTASPIELSLDTANLNGKLSAGKEVQLLTRKAREGDCICSNESAYYRPLAQVEFFSPGVTIDGGFTGRGLGTQWTIPGSRSSYMATFAY